MKTIQFKKIEWGRVCDKICDGLAWIFDLIWKLWVTLIAFFVICAITLGISVYFADEDFQKLNVRYTDAMVPWMNDRIDDYILTVFPWVLVAFLVLLVLYKKFFEE